MLAFDIAAEKRFVLGDIFFLYDDLSSLSSTIGVEDSTGQNYLLVTPTNDDRNDVLYYNKAFRIWNRHATEVYYDLVPNPVVSGGQSVLETYHKSSYPGLIEGTVFIMQEDHILSVDYLGIARVRNHCAFVQAYSRSVQTRKLYERDQLV